MKRLRQRHKLIMKNESEANCSCKLWGMLSLNMGRERAEQEFEGHLACMDRRTSFYKKYYANSGV